MNQRTRIYLVMGSVVAYVLSFVPIYSAVGGVAGSLTVLPVVTAGWLLGLSTGVLFGLLSLPLNFLLYALVRDPGLTKLTSLALASLACTVVGAAVGGLKQLLDQVKERSRELAREREVLKEQIAERKRAEEESQVVGQILHSLNAAMDVTEAFPAVVASLKAITGCERISLALFDESREWFTIVALDQPRAALSQGSRMRLSDTAAAEDVLAGRPHLTPDLATEADFPAERALYQAGHRSRINVPLRVRKQVIGALNLAWSRPAGCDVMHLPLFGQITDAIALAVERSRLLEAAQQQARQQAALFRLSAELTATLDEVEICQRVVHGLHDTLGYDYLGVFLVDEATGERVLQASAGWTNAPPNWRIPPGHGLSERALLDGQLHYTPDVTRDPHYVPGLNSGAEVDVPLRIGEQVPGVLAVESLQPNAFDQNDFAVLTAAANQASVAMERAREHRAG